MKTEWRIIAGFDNYAVSSSGDIKSLERWCAAGPGAKGLRFVRERILRPETDKHGYLKVVLSKDGKTFKRQVHRLVASAFIENPLGLPQVNHLDGVKSRNCVGNLEWASVSRNVKHAYDVLDKPRMSGELHGLSKLTEEQVKAIRADVRSQSIIAAEYGVQQPSVSKIKRRERWAHL